MSRGVRYREGEVAWVDLTTSDIERSGEFYGELFGWDIDDLGDAGGGYRFATVAGHPVAGLLPTSDDDPIESWTVYLAVDDIDEAYARAVREGAHPLVTPQRLAEQGHFALVADPGGAVLGLWQGARHAGTQVLTFAGSPGWFENHTKGYDAACDFYGRAFAMRVEPLADDEGFRYATSRLDGEERPAFGVFDVSTGRSAELPSTWAVYFLTADADRDAERAVALGARLTFGPEDSVYGRMATFIDPLGAAFNLIEPPLPEPDPAAAAPLPAVGEVAAGEADADADVLETDADVLDADAHAGPHDDVPAADGSDGDLDAAADTDAGSHDEAASADAGPEPVAVEPGPEPDGRDADDAEPKPDGRDADDDDAGPEPDGRDADPASDRDEDATR